MYGIAALMCGPRLLCLARLDRLHLLQLAVGGAVPRSADGPPKVRPRTSCGGLPSILNDRSVDIQSRHCARHVDVDLISRPQRPQTWLCRIGEWHPLRAVKLLSLVSYKLDYQTANSYARRCLHLLAYRQRAVARWHWYW